MLLGLVIYTAGAKYLPRARPVSPEAVRPPTSASNRATILLLFGVVIAVTVFRGAYEQVGNTVALWADVGIDRRIGAAEIPMTWFQSLNPLLVFLMTPLLLAQWRRGAARGTEPSPLRKMSRGATIVGVAYLLLAAVSAWAGAGSANWIWLALFFAIFTLGELYILPTGLCLFISLAPAGFGKTTVAAWFLAIFTGSLAAGAIGTLWSHMQHAAYFVILALLGMTAAAMLLTLDRIWGRQIN